MGGGRDCGAGAGPSSRGPPSPRSPLKLLQKDVEVQALLGVQERDLENTQPGVWHLEEARSPTPVGAPSPGPGPTSLGSFLAGAAAGSLGLATGKEKSRSMLEKSGSTTSGPRPLSDAHMELRSAGEGVRLMPAPGTEGQVAWQRKPFGCWQAVWTRMDHTGPGWQRPWP